MLEMKRPYSNRGQATVETLVSMLALVPLFILIPYLGKYLDVKSKSTEAVRYATWERAVFSDAQSDWDSGEHNKSDQTIALETRTRILGDPRVGIESPVTGIVTRNPLWLNHTGGELVSVNRFAQGTNGGLSIREIESDVSRGLTVDLLARGNGVSGLVGLDGLDLNQNGNAASSVEITLARLPDFDRRGASIDIETTGVTDEPRSMGETGGMLTDAWVPGDEDNFNDRIDGLVTDEVLQLFVFPATETFGNTQMFEEGEKGQDPQLESESRVIPRKYIDDFGRADR